MINKYNDTKRFQFELKDDPRFFHSSFKAGFMPEAA